MIFIDVQNLVHLFYFLMIVDTNIFVADKCKTKVYEKANKVLEMIYRYMSCNLLHINLKKCCYIHFTPILKDTLLLRIIGIVIKRVQETKFLGVIIDEKLKWGPHIKYLNSKLKCEIGKLYKMKGCTYQQNCMRTHYLSHI